MKLHQTRKNGGSTQAEAQEQLPAAPRYKIRAVYENNFKVGSKQYYGLDSSRMSLVFGQNGDSRIVELKKHDADQQLTPARQETSIPILYNVDIPYRLRTADEQPEDLPLRPTNNAVHSFKLYSLPTAQLETFKKDMACCAHLRKVEYEAHEDKARCC